MTFDWKEFNYLAKELPDLSATQASYRTSVSRAYYAAFAIAKRWTRITARSKNVHEMVKERLRELSEDGEILVAYNHLNKLREDRNLADYDNQKEFTRSDATSAVYKAEIVIKTLLDMPQM